MESFPEADESALSERGILESRILLSSVPAVKGGTPLRASASGGRHLLDGCARARCPSRTPEAPPRIDLRGGGDPPSPRIGGGTGIGHPRIRSPESRADPHPGPRPSLSRRPASKPRRVS